MSRSKPISIERRIEKLWYGDSRLALLLLPFSGLFRLLVAARRLAYRIGLFKRRNCGVPVVVVGNITVGGAGKTPLVGWIAARLAAEGLKVGILSRGYGGSGGEEPRFVTRDSLANDVGDEAVLLAWQTSARVCVCADRVAGARRLVDEAHVDLIICDDGLQHYRLERAVEIAVVDGARGLGNRHMLPAGPLREPVSRLREVDLVFVNGDSTLIEGRRFELRPGRVRAVAGTEERNLGDFSGRQVWAVAGIGNPARFVEMLRAAGIEPQAVDVPDHGRISLDALTDEQPWPILMTAKDAVKYPSKPTGEAWYVPVDLKMSPPDEAALMEQLRKLYVEL